MSKKCGALGKWVVVGALLVALAVFLATLAYYPAVQLRCWLDSTQCPVVERESAQDVGDHLVREITEPTRFWIFHAKGGKIVEEVEYVPDTPLHVLPAGEEDAVLIYSNYPFSRLSFTWEEWAALPEGTLQAHRWQNDKWTHVGTAQTGRVPKGPPDEGGYQLNWDCQWLVSDATPVPIYGQMGYAVRLTTSGQFSKDAEIVVELLPCVPTWDPDNPEWEVVKIERVSACQNIGRAGWSGKMLQVWVEDESGDPLQGVEASFTSSHGYGIAWDRQNVGGWTNRFGLVEWNHWGVPTRYMFFVGDDQQPLAWNLRTDLGYEYCGGTTFGGWRPPNKPGWYSYGVWVRRKGER